MQFAYSAIVSLCVSPSLSLLLLLRNLRTLGKSICTSQQHEKQFFSLCWWHNEISAHHRSKRLMCKFFFSFSSTICEMRSRICTNHEDNFLESNVTCLAQFSTSTSLEQNEGFIFLISPKNLMPKHTPDAIFNHLWDINVDENALICCFGTVLLSIKQNKDKHLEEFFLVLISLPLLLKSHEKRMKKCSYKMK
jgi:hypothetical protein